jgi:hypothetical protein
MIRCKYSHCHKSWCRNWLTGANFPYIFSGQNFGENSAENFTPKNVGEKWNFQRKKLWKIVFPRKIDFPRKKMYEKSAPDYVDFVSTFVSWQTTAGLGAHWVFGRLELGSNRLRLKSTLWCLEIWT